MGQAQERRGLDLSGLRHETLKPHRKAETRPEIPGGLFLLCGALLLGVRIRRFTGSGELGLCGLEPQHTALGVIETAEQDGENIDQPADPAGPGRQQPDDACAGFTDIEPMGPEEAEEDAQQQRHRLAFRRRRPLRCGDADRALLRAGLPAGARRIRQARPGDPDGRVAFPRRADRVLQTLRAEADARALFVQVYPDTRGHLKAASKPCTHAFPSYVRFLAFSHLWHNITMPKLVKSILHSHL